MALPAGPGSPQPGHLPLRVTLASKTFQELLQRLQKIANAPTEDPLRKALIQQKAILPDMTIPFQQWNQAAELVETFRAPCSATRFHALPAPQDSKIVTWNGDSNSQ